MPGSGQVGGELPRELGGHRLSLDRLAEDGEGLESLLVDSLGPGDTGCIRAGTYHEQNITIRNGGSGDDARVTIASYPGERATIDGRVYVADSANYVTVRDKESDVRIGKQGDYLRLKVKDHGPNGEDVEMKLPLEVVAALLSSDGDELNFVAALEALARRGEGELLTVNGNEETVRIWVDSHSERR